MDGYLPGIDEQYRMAQWQIVAGDGGVLANDYLDEGIVTMGGDVGDISEMTAAEIEGAAERPELAQFAGAGEDGMAVGDSVLVYEPGRKLVIGVGDIISECYYEPDNDLDLNHPYWRDVTWQELGTPVKLHELPDAVRDDVIDFDTLDQFNGEFASLRETVAEAKQTDEESLSDDIFSPQSEDQVKAYIYNNIMKLGDFDNPEMDSDTGVGTVDVIADGPAADTTTAIEVKLGTAGDGAIGKLMGYLRGLEGQNGTVNGILVAEGFEDRVKAIAETDENIQLRKFSLGVQFERAE
jgi:hypothetical protein